MKFKEWIKNLKIPRLLIEAALIFGSVYFALILEADRSKDFEREVLIDKLNVLHELAYQDSMRITELMLKEDTNQLRKEWNYYYFAQKDSILLLYLTDMEYENEILNFNELVDNWVIRSYSEFWTRIKPNFKATIENNDAVILNKDLIEVINAYIHFKEEISLNHIELNEFQERFKEKYYSDYFFGKEQLNEIISASHKVSDYRELRSSRYFLNMVTDRANLFRNITIKFSEELAYDVIPVMQQKFQSEIQAQEEAMKGIL